MTGRAFINQPTFGDNPAARNRESAQQQGDWWIGGAENRPSENDAPTGQHPDGADPPQGTLISPCFRIVGRDISCLIGGGCTIRDIRAELFVNNQVRLFTLTIMFCLITLKQPELIYQSSRGLIFQNCETILSFVISMRFVLVYNKLFTRKKIYFK